MEQTDIGKADKLSLSSGHLLKGTGTDTDRESRNWELLLFFKTLHLHITPLLCAMPLHLTDGAS